MYYFLIRNSIMNTNLNRLLGLLIFCLLVACKKEETPPEDCVSSTTIQLLNTTDAPCGSPTGLLEIATENGIQYRINDEAFGTTGRFENLLPGVYIITAMDEMGCTKKANFNVRSGVSLSAEVLPIIGATCALSGCHVAGGQNPDFTVKADIISSAQSIKGNIISNAMPPNNTSGPDLSVTDIETITCWIDDGAEDN